VRQAALDEVAAKEITSGTALWRALGEALPTRAPRKGLVQAAATAGVAIFTPDLSASALGAALLAARTQGAALSLDASGDLAGLARILGAQPNLGVVRVGVGLEDNLLFQAREAAVVVGARRPTLVGDVALSASVASQALGQHSGEVISVATDATLALPLLVTGLAQRIPGVRHLAPRDDVRLAEPALA